MSLQAEVPVRVSRPGCASEPSQTWFWLPQVCTIEIPSGLTPYPNATNSYSLLDFPHSFLSRFWGSMFSHLVIIFNLFNSFWLRWNGQLGVAACHVPRDKYTWWWRLNSSQDQLLFLQSRFFLFYCSWTPETPKSHFWVTYKSSTLNPMYESRPKLRCTTMIVYTNLSSGYLYEET